MRPGKIFFQLSPNPLLGTGKRIRKALRHLFGNPGFLHGKMVRRRVFSGFNPLHAQKEQEKLIKCQTAPGLLQNSPAFRKMNLTQSIADAAEVVTRADFVGKIITFRGFHIQQLLHGLTDCAVGKPRREAVDRKQLSAEFFVFLRTENLRMLHDSSAAFFRDGSAEDIQFSCLKGAPQKRHMKPVYLQSFFAVPEDNHGNRLFPEGSNRWPRRQDSSHGIFFTRHSFPGGNRFLVTVILSGIIMKQILQAADPGLRKQPLCFFSDPLQRPQGLVS